MAKLKDLTVSGDSSIGGDLTVSGTITGNVTGTSSGNIETLSVSGKTITYTKSSGTTGTITTQDTDTKNTAGTTNKVDTKMFLVGATEQNSNPQTYSNVNTYIDANNELHLTNRPYIDKREFTGLLASANQADGADFMLYKIKPKTYDGPWHARFYIEASYTSGSSTYSQFSEIDVYGQGNVNGATRSFNSVTSTSYRPFYYGVIYRISSAANYALTTAAGYVYLGLYMYNCNNTTSGCERTLKVTLTELDGCYPVTDTTNFGLITPANTDYTTYLASSHTRTTWDCSAQGMQETGDSSNYDTLYYSSQVYAGSSGIYGGNLILQKPDGTWESVSNSSSTETTKTFNTNGFIVGSKIYYAPNTVAAGSRMSTWALRDGLSGINIRYDWNGGSTLVSGYGVYLVGKITNGLFYVDSTTPITQTIPTTADGKIYIYIGIAYNTTNAHFNVDNPWYYHDGITFREYGTGDLDWVEY